MTEPSTRQTTPLVGWISRKNELHSRKFDRMDSAAKAECYRADNKIHAVKRATRVKSICTVVQDILHNIIGKLYTSSVLPMNAYRCLSVIMFMLRLFVVEASVFVVEFCVR